MISRRSFSFRACCTAGSVFIPAYRAISREAPSDFICSTIDTVPGQDTEFAIVPYSNPPSKKEMELDLKNDGFQLTDFGTASLKDRWLRGDGLTPNSGQLTLGVYFLDGSPAQQAEFKSAADVWVSKLKGALAFEYVTSVGKSQIRVTFNTSVNESYIGRSCLSIRPSSPTMWIANVVPYIIQHECGHALGLQHEHQNPNTPFVWNRPKVFADMKARGWSDEQTQANIIDRFSKNYACVGDPEFNEKSIMLYPVPSSWTSETFSSNENKSITNRDIMCVFSLIKKA